MRAALIFTWSVPANGTSWRSRAASMAISAFFGLNEKRSCLSIERVAELVQMPYRATLRLIKNAHHKLMEFNSDLNEVIPLD